MVKLRERIYRPLERYVLQCGTICSNAPVLLDKHDELYAPQSSFMRGENGKLGGGGGLSRNSNGNGNSNISGSEAGMGLTGTQPTACDNQNLPWLLSLAKTVAMLAGRMAATIVVGDSGVSPFLEKYYCSPAYSSWLASDLLKDGCDPSYEGLMLAPLDVTSRDGSSSVGIPPAVNTHNVSLGGFTVPTSDVSRSRKRNDDFLEGVASGNGQGGRFASWLAEALAPSNAAYRIIKRQAETGPDGRALARVERTMMAAMLRHGGLDGDAILFSACWEHQGRDEAVRRDRQPPRRLAALWKSTAEVSTILPAVLARRYWRGFRYQWCVFFPCFHCVCHLALV